MNDTEDLQELALRLGSFADVLNQHAVHLLQQTGQSTEALRETVANFAAQAQQVSRQLVQSVAAQAREVIEQQAGEGLRKHGERMHDAATRAESAAVGLQRQLQQLASAQHSLVWKSGLALIIGSLLAIGGSAYWIWKIHQEIEQTQFPIAIAQALRTGAITNCGDAICARVATKPRRFGDKGQYVEIK